MIRCSRPSHTRFHRARQGRSRSPRLACLLARGHLLIEDVPGVGKTTLAHALARVLGLPWQRVQFTSDLLPADILGVSIFDRATQNSSSARARCSRSCCWPTKSIAPAHDPERLAGGHGGTSGQRRWHACAARALLRGGHAEPS